MKNVRILEEAAVISDTFTLSHKKNFFTRSQNNNYSKSSDSYNKSVLESHSSTSSQSSPQCGFRSGPGRFEGSSGIGSLPTCCYCKRKSHLSVSVLNLNEKNDLDKQQPLACSAVRGDQGTIVSFCYDIPEVHGSKSSSTDSMKDYKSFWSQGIHLMTPAKLTLLIC